MTQGKINRLINILIPITEKSDMTKRHASMLISGGKPLTLGHNHDRMTSRGKTILSYHAEVHAISQFIDINNAYHLKNYLNDTDKCISFRKKTPSDLTPTSMV